MSFASYDAAVVHKSSFSYLYSYTIIRFPIELDQHFFLDPSLPAIKKIEYAARRIYHGLDITVAINFVPFSYQFEGHASPIRAKEVFDLLGFQDSNYLLLVSTEPLSFEYSSYDGSQVQKIKLALDSRLHLTSIYSIDNEGRWRRYVPQPSPMVVPSFCTIM